MKYVHKAYGLNECGLVVLTYPREKNNSVSGFILYSFHTMYDVSVGSFLIARSISIKARTHFEHFRANVTNADPW